MQEPKKAEITDEQLKDGMENIMAQLGTGQDKRNASKFVNRKRLSADGNQQELNDLYRTCWMAGKIVDIIPDDMTREWRTFTGEIEPKEVKKLTDEENRLELSFKFNQAHKWARLYGTAFIIISVDDGQTPDKPLNINKVKKGGLNHINVIDRHRLNNAEVVPISDPMNAKFGMPEFYRFNETSVKIHHSRVLRFDGIRIPYDEFRRNNFFSDSVLDRLYDAITNLETATNSSASMIYEANVDIIKIKGLMNYLQNPESEALLRRRFTLAGAMKSFNNMMLLDSEEETTSKTNPFTGLADLMDRYGLFLSGASDIPATRLLGSSASGLNATGEGDLKNYYDTIASTQIKEYKPSLDYFDKIMAKSLGLPEDDLEYTFNSLFQMTPKEKSDIEFQDAQRDQIYITNSVVTEEIVAKDLKQNKVYTNLDDDYIEELEGDENGLITNTNSTESEFEQENEIEQNKESEPGKNT